MKRFAPFVLLAGAVLVIGSSAIRASVASRVLKAPPQVVSPAGTLRIGSLVSCTSHSTRVVVRVPRRGQSVAKTAAGAHGSATIRLTTRADGSVVASCG